MTHRSYVWYWVDSGGTRRIYFLESGRRKSYVRVEAFLGSSGVALIHVLHPSHNKQRLRALGSKQEQVDYVVAPLSTTVVGCFPLRVRTPSGLLFFVWSFRVPGIDYLWSPLLAAVVLQYVLYSSVRSVPPTCPHRLHIHIEEGHLFSEWDYVWYVCT